MQAPDVVAMDTDFCENSDEFDQQERHTILERLEVGVGDRYSDIQPNSAPVIDKGLIGNVFKFACSIFSVMVEKSFAGSKGS